jgi:hypothetical protein
MEGVTTVPDGAQTTNIRMGSRFPDRRSAANYRCLPVSHRPRCVAFQSAAHCGDSNHAGRQRAVRALGRQFGGPHTAALRSSNLDNPSHPFHDGKSSVRFLGIRKLCYRSERSKAAALSTNAYRYELITGATYCFQHHAKTVQERPGTFV